MRIEQGSHFRPLDLNRITPGGGSIKIQASINRKKAILQMKVLMWKSFSKIQDFQILEKYRLTADAEPVFLFELEYLIFVKDSTVKSFFLMCNNCSADRITCNINSSTEHIKNTVDTHNQGNSLGWKSNAL